MLSYRKFHLKPLMKSSSFDNRASKRAAGGGIAVCRPKRMDFGGRPNAQTALCVASVAIDGNCTRNMQSVCWYVKADCNTVNLGGTAVHRQMIVPKGGSIPFFGFFYLLLKKTYFIWRRVCKFLMKNFLFDGKAPPICKANGIYYTHHNKK